MVTANKTAIIPTVGTSTTTSTTATTITTSLLESASLWFEVNLTTDTTTTGNTTIDSIATTTTTTPTHSVLSTASRVLLAVVLMVAMLVGVAGNIVLCGLVYRKAAMRSAVNLLVAQLALSDVLLALLVMPSALVGLVVAPQSATAGWSKELCAAMGCLHRLLTTLNVYLLAAVSVDRCLIIVHRQDRLTVYRALLIVLSAWAVSLLLSLCPLLGWGRLAMYPGHPLCWHVTPQGATDLSYIVVNCLLSQGLPLAAIFYSYIQIVRTVRLKNRKVHHCPVGVGAGLADVPRPQPRVSVTRSLREFTCPGPNSPNHLGLCLACGMSQHGQSQDNTLSQPCVCYVSVSSSVFLLPPPSTCSSPRSCHGEVPKSPASSAKGVHPVMVLPYRSEPSQSCCPSCSPLSLPCSASSDVLLAATSLDASDTASFSGNTTNSSTFNTRRESHRPPNLLHFQPARSPRPRSTRKQAMDSNLKTRAFQTLLLLALLLSLCYLPYVVAVVATSMVSHDHPGLLCVFLWLLYVKTGLNPVLYVCRIRKYRTACRDAVPGWLRRCVRCGCGGALFTRRVDPGAAYQCPEQSVSVTA